MSGLTESTKRLCDACNSGDIIGVRQALTSHDVDVNAASETYGVLTPLHLAAFFGHLDICKLLLRQPGINPYALIDPDTGHQPVHFAAQKGYTDIVRLFLKEPLHIHAAMDKLHVNLVALEAGLFDNLSHAFIDSLAAFALCKQMKEETLIGQSRIKRRFIIRKDDKLVISQVLCDNITVL